mgnify:CR=1 FL=1
MKIERSNSSAGVGQNQREIVGEGASSDLFDHVLENEVTGLLSEAAWRCRDSQRSVGARAHDPVPCGPGDLAALDDGESCSGDIGSREKVFDLGARWCSARLTWWRPDGSSTEEHRPQP